jgi:hypothetical protein
LTPNNAVGLDLEKAKYTVKSLHAIAECYAETCNAIKSTAKETGQTKKLWREGNKSNLIRIGVACIVFPEPTPISETIGAGLVLAGAVQQCIKNRALYVGDIKKNLELTLRQLSSTQDKIRL